MPRLREVNIARYRAKAAGKEQVMRFRQHAADGECIGRECWMVMPFASVR